MALALNPVNIFNQGAMEERAETARLSSFVGAVAVGDLVKSTLGPKGMDKILLNPSGAARGEPLVTVTNDGATILRQVGLDNPAAKILQETAKVQDDEVGDGTTSVTESGLNLKIVTKTKMAGNGQKSHKMQLSDPQKHPELLFKKYCLT